MSNQDAAKLQVVQNKCLRICLQAESRSSVASLHEKAKLPLLNDRRKMHTCKFTYEGLQNKASENVNNMFTFVNETHIVNTRASTEARAAKPNVNLETCKNNVRVRGPKYFNEMPIHVRTAPSSACFKSRIKKLII